MREAKDLYEILQVHPSAHPDVINAAYRRLALLYHPDKNPSPEAAGRMKQINLAYETLGDPSERARYDRMRVGLQGERAEAHRYSHREEPVRASRARDRSGPQPTTRRAFFTLGSSKDDVLHAQGTPTDFDFSTHSETWHYDYGSITFSLPDELVASWHNYGDLKAQLLPKDDMY